MANEVAWNTTTHSSQKSDDAVRAETSNATTPTKTDEMSKDAATKKRNAFSELMAPKPKQLKANTDPTHLNATEFKRDGYRLGLLRYIQNPSSFAPSTILRVTKDTVLIRDLFPKALVHLLLLPRDEAFHTLKPFEAFNSRANANFLELMRKEAASASDLAASELSRLVSPHSQTAKTREEALDEFDPEAGGEATLPPARDFRSDIRVGIHAEPSMDTLHIHIISVDMHSDRLKHKKHYNSFTTPFFVPLEDFPLKDDDERMQEDRQHDWVKGDMKCWRCGKNFTNKFKELKGHLEQEFTEWRRA